MKKNFLNIFFLLASILLFVNQALALTATATFNVTDVFLVSAQPLSFVTYLSNANSDASTTITVTCNTGTGYTVALDNGSYFATTRNMQLVSGTTTLSYLLYSDNGRTTAWTTLTGQTGAGAAQNVIVYGLCGSFRADCCSRWYVW